MTAAAAGATLPECTPAERWAKPTIYAVRKPGRKTALRVLDTETAARELAAATPNGYVEIRPGESVRCADYCAVAEFCAQRRAELAALSAERGGLMHVRIDTDARTPAERATARRSAACHRGRARAEPRKRKPGLRSRRPTSRVGRRRTTDHD